MASHSVAWQPSLQNSLKTEGVAMGKTSICNCTSPGVALGVLDLVQHLLNSGFATECQEGHLWHSRWCTSPIAD